MADSFTMFGKFGDALEVLPEDDRKTMLYALGIYGLYGEEIELPPVLKAIFIAFKEDVDNSKNSRKNGSRGGRPKRVTEDEKPPVSEMEKPPVSENENPRLYIDQTKPDQTNTGQTKVARGGKQPFKRPTVDDVRRYAAEQGHPSFDAGKFIDYYDSNGWKVGKNAMKDWKATVRNWLRNDFPSAKQSQKGVTHDDFSEYIREGEQVVYEP